MNVLKKGLSFVGRDTHRGAYILPLLQHQIRMAISVKSYQNTKVTPETSGEQRKYFSGIQPTGSLHLGNYLGALQNWTSLQNSDEDVTFCIVDMHAMTVPQEPIALRENIFEMAAAMLACGIDPDMSTIFVQSAVKEHAELSWILTCMTTMARLSHLPQYKEKTRAVKDVPLGLFVYPVLQAADILLYKATHVPIGEDQVQHIQLAQHLARTFNNRYGPTFPICHSVISNKTSSRIRSLRDPSKKMSKSDSDQKAVINITDDPDVIVEKVKKAVTDFCSDVHYSPETRQGVSNLIAIHSLLSGKTVEEICEEAKRMDTGKYKLHVADVIIEHLRPIRNKIKQQLVRRNELVYLLEVGAEKARQTAAATLAEVKQKLGMGAHPHMPVPLDVREESKMSTNISNVTRKASIGDGRLPKVPQQQLRIEKEGQMRVQIHSTASMEFHRQQREGKTVSITKPPVSPKQVAAPKPVAALKPVPAPKLVAVPIPMAAEPSSATAKPLTPRKSTPTEKGSDMAVTEQQSKEVNI